MPKYVFKEHLIFEHLYGPLPMFYSTCIEYLRVRNPQDVSRTSEVLWTELFKI